MQHYVIVWGERVFGPYGVAEAFAAQARLSGTPEAKRGPKPRVRMIEPEPMEPEYEHAYDGVPTSEPCSGADTCPDCIEVREGSERIIAEAEALSRSCDGCGADAGSPCRWGCLSNVS